VDLLKYDNCNGDGSSAQSRDTTMRDALAHSGRSILFSLCEWGVDNVWTWGSGVGNMWRTTGDINDSYGSLLSIFHANVKLAQYAGPGGWNDPDMLEVGNGGMSFTEDRSEFGLWAEMAAPLITGNDLPNSSAATVSILGDRDVIAVDQDALGRQGRQISSSGGLDVLAKPLAGGDVSVALFNENSGAATISTTASAVGMPSSSTGYTLDNLWSHVKTPTSGAISATVPGHGTVLLRVSTGSATTTGTTHPLIGASSNRCLDAYDNQTAAGTKIEIWDCNGGANQQWNVNDNGTITSVQTGLCLAVNGTANSSAVNVATCNNAANQRWSKA
jgi:alpha-galactosidase